MKKNNQKSILEKIGFLFISLVLVGFIYGGLTINKIQKDNNNLNKKQAVSETQIVNLQSQIIDNQNKLAQTTTDLENISKDLTKTKNDLAYYKKLALEQKEILATTDTKPTVVDQPIDIKPAIQTITKKVYIKEQPKYEASVVVEGVGKYKVAVVSGDTAYKVLKKASDQNGFSLKTTNWGGDLGISIDGIGSINPTLDEHKFWAFYYNNTFSNVGVSSQTVAADDIIYFVLNSW